MRLLREYLFEFYRRKYKPIRNSDVSDGITILLPEGNDNWILRGIAKEIKAIYPEVQIVSDVSSIVTDKILIMHYSLLRTLFRNRISLERVSVFFTHPRPDLYNNRKEFQHYFSKLSTLFIMNGGDKSLDIFKGHESKLVVAVGGYEKEMFGRISGQNKKNVCFVSRFYERKNPNLILKIIQSNPDHQFFILGRGWEEWSKFSTLIACHNFRYIVTDYRNYNEFYQQMNYFITVSTKEGGPIPLLESMSCGITPISTNTGFAGDVLEEGINGYVLDNSTSDDAKLEKIRKIFEMGPLNEDVIIKSVDKFDWQNFSSLVVNKMLNEDYKV